MKKTTDILLQAIAALDGLENESIVDGKSLLFLEIEKAPAPSSEELRINGNVHGLVYFATMILKTAARGTLGAHVHFDGSSDIERCDMPLVVCLKAAPWEDASETRARGEVNE